MNHHDLELDLEKIEHLGRIREDENFRFRNFLKGHNARKIDLLVHRLNEEIAPQIDCTACGNCCRRLSPCLTKNDLKNLSEGLNLPASEVVEKYTETIEKELSLKHLPCSFLVENKCSIYANRPETCASFPHLHKDHFTSRLRAAISNYSICPIVFNVMEQLKQEMHFR